MAGDGGESRGGEGRGIASPSHSHPRWGTGRTSPPTNAEQCVGDVLGAAADGFVDGFVGGTVASRNPGVGVAVGLAMAVASGGREVVSGEACVAARRNGGGR